jgi:hypothetical protein
MGTLTDAAEDRYDESMVLGDPTGPDEPPEFDCPACGGPAHCRTGCDRRFAVLQCELVAWNAFYDRARRYLPEHLVVDGDRFREPF